MMRLKKDSEPDMYAAAKDRLTNWYTDENIGNSGVNYFTKKQSNGEDNSPAVGSVNSKIISGPVGIYPDKNYMESMINNESVGNVFGAKRDELDRNRKIDMGYGNGYEKTNYYNYSPKYTQKADELRQQLEDYKEFDYDPANDKAYQALARVYGTNANKAYKDAMAIAAAANGGRLSGGVLSAAGNAYANVMSGLDAEIPQLREAAYSMYRDGKNDVRNLMYDYEAAEDVNYNRWADDYNRNNEALWNYLKWSREGEQWNKNFGLNEKQINAQIDSMMKNDEIQASIMGGFVTKKAAELFPGLEEGAPTNEALNQYLSRQIQVAEGMGRYWDSLAQSYGADYGSNSVARDQMDKNYDIGLKEIALTREQMEKNYDIDLRKLAQNQQQIDYNTGKGSGGGKSVSGSGNSSVDYGTTNPPASTQDVYDTIMNSGGSDMDKIKKISSMQARGDLTSAQADELYEKLGR